MNQKTFTFLAGLVFSLIAVLHVLRLLLGWKAAIGGWDIPLWLSWIATVLFGSLAYVAFTLRR